MKYLKNNKAQSLISIMLFVMVLGIIVTLIIASSITDTKRLVSQKSYERAYSLADNYISKILSSPGEVFGATIDNLQDNVLNEVGNDQISCAYDQTDIVIGGTNNENLYKTVSFNCNGSGPNKDSSVSCIRNPSSMGLSMTGIKDKKLKLNLEGYTISGSEVPIIAFKIDDADAILINYKYTKAYNANLKYDQDTSFGIQFGNNSAYNGMVKVDKPLDTINFSSLSAVFPALKCRLTNCDGVTNFSGTQNAIISLPGGLGNDFYDSLDDASYGFAIDLDQLAYNIYKTDDYNVAVANYNTVFIPKSLEVIFLNRDNKNATYSIKLSGFNSAVYPDKVRYPFQRISCKANDSSVSGSTTIAGFGSAELETYKPLNKSINGLFDYSLYIGQQDNAINLDDGASINK